ncbi:HDOD domain-containing protein [Neptuniibacter sp. CAU 1671]|uniref:HDOD domain-containing protein n=1 Tax=Neptuniibacter sp. CAU 1671 TaxID=3032593 RepID=UPI0023DBF05D|nr:HDOD domain-containing protein [Neptuniibacter sp. CAU 1671]MDF2182163.1 HDOD domain-containing protein [Neptuniibacter sp. CAU 1671]
MPLNTTLNRIQQNLGSLGDLPVFSNTLLRIKQISSSDESDAMGLAMVIMKDPNLTARLLTLANSSTYHRGSGPIRVISRAVVLLGFNQIKNLSMTLKLVEQFQSAHPDLDVPELMARAVLSANLARELAVQSRRRVDAEEAYISALLQNIGEIIVACTLPDTYRNMLGKRAMGESWPKVQEEVLGSSFSHLGQELAISWGYNSEVMTRLRSEKFDARLSSVDATAALSRISGHVLQHLFAPDDADKSFNELISQVAEITDLPLDEVTGVVVHSFKKVTKVCRDIGLSQKHLMPAYAETGEPDRDDLIRQVSFLVHSEVESESSQQQVNFQLHNVMQENDRNKQVLEYLRRFAQCMAAGDQLHEVLKLFVDSVNACSGFDRVIIGLMDPQGTRLSVKLLAGKQIEPLQTYFQREKNGGADDLFFRVIMRQHTFLVEDAMEGGWQQRLPENFKAQVNCRGFVLEPLSRGKRAVGMLYADYLHDREAISAEDFECFMQMAGQVRLALNHAGRTG